MIMLEIIAFHYQYRNKVGNEKEMYSAWNHSLVHRDSCTSIKWTKDK